MSRFARLGTLPGLMFLLSAPLATAQEATAPAGAPAQLDPAAAAALLDRACEVMLALPAGAFTSDLELDSAIGRGSGMPGMAGDGTRVRGGWKGDLRWGDTDDDTFVVQNGRMVTKGRDGWKLRSKKLTSGGEAPYLAAPRLLFRQLQSLPAAARTVAHVEADDMRGTPVQIVSLQLQAAAAEDLALSGALPQPGSGMFFPMGGMFGGGPPQMTYTVDLALSIDPATGRVLRVRSKSYEDNPVLANVRIQFGQGGGDDEPEDASADRDDDAPAGAIEWKKGLPVRKPSRTESVAYFKLDFQDHGEATPPEVDEAGSRWLEDR
ncbi:MAG: hypothetical protein AB7O97_19365 [Planctomycetota bacterium]